MVWARARCEKFLANCRAQALGTPEPAVRYFREHAGLLRTLMYSANNAPLAVVYTALAAACRCVDSPRGATGASGVLAGG